jgi:hypothetical protein
MHAILYEIAFNEKDEKAMERELDILKVPASDRPPLTSLIYFGRLSEVRKRDSSPRDRTQLLLGYGAPAESDAKAALRQNRRLRDTAVTAAIAGDLEGVKALEEMSKESPEDTLLNLIDLPTAEAAYALHSGDAAKTIQILRPVVRFEPGARSLLGTYIRGQAYLQTRSGPQAAEEFQKILTHRDVLARSILIPLSHLGLARAYVLAGDAMKARKSYEDLFAIWKEADADIPVLVEAKAEYAKLGILSTR